MTTGSASVAVVEIEETTVGDLDGVPVPFGNAWEGEYVGRGGSSCTGYSGVLFLPGGAVRVGRGSELTVGGQAWRVVDVARRGGHGVVRLERA